jgi:hypothetical protein
MSSNVKNRGKSFVNILNIVSRTEQVKFEEQSRIEACRRRDHVKRCQADDKWNFTGTGGTGAPFAAVVDRPNVGYYVKLRDGKFSYHIE